VSDEKASHSNRLIYRWVKEALGAKPLIARYHDDDEAHRVDVASLADGRWPGYSIYSTIGLAESPLFHRSGDPFPLRVEIMGGCQTDCGWFPNALATCAFFVMKDHWLPRPGVVFETLVEMYDASSMLKHFYFTEPWDWEILHEVRQLPDRTFTWLWTFPISDGESRLVSEEGGEAFEVLLRRENVNVYDVRRSPLR
jgi:hypothetical protein